jgi:pantothenate kinase
VLVLVINAAMEELRANYDTFSALRGPAAVAFGVDGYHLPDEVLHQRRIHHFKGRPPTLDLASLSHDLEAVLNQSPGEPVIQIPWYDRTAHSPRPDGQIIAAPPEGPIIVIVEGILLFTGHFLRHGDPFALKIFMDLPEPVARARVNARKVAGGRSHQDTEDHYMRVDRPNHDEMAAVRDACDFVLQQSETSEYGYRIVDRGGG